MSTNSTEEKGTDEKQKAADKPGKDDVHEQREPEQSAEGMTEEKPAKR